MRACPDRQQIKHLLNKKKIELLGTHLFSDLHRPGPVLTSLSMLAHLTAQQFYDG
jgi:hypothetical protein